MARIEKTVFLSYRRTNAPWALAISQNLTHNGYDVFFDFTGLASGDFEGVILDNIHARAHFLVLLTPSALERSGESGDWLRREIEAALDSKRNIIPLMLEGFDFGTPSIANQLTGKLATLRRYNSMTVSAEYFEAAMEKLRKFLNVALDTVVQPASAIAAQAATEAKVAAAQAPAVVEEELTAQQWFERGLNARDTDEKLRFYSNAIRLRPDYVSAINNRGLARKDRGDLDGAIADFNEAIRIEPAADIFSNRGNAHYEKLDRLAALSDYDEAIRRDPHYTNAWINRGIVRHDAGDLDGAVLDYNEAIQLDRDSADIFNNRGLALTAKDNLTGALADFNESIRLKPDYAAAFNNRGLLRMGSGDLAGAIEDFTEAIRLEPNYFNPYRHRGSILLAEGDLIAALQDFDEAIRLKPDDTDALKKREAVREALVSRKRGES